jgi:RNA polymerase sigma factor (sigma-70 family)
MMNRFVAWMRPETDESLLQRSIARQDDGAFTILVKRYGNLIYSICSKELTRPVDIEDASQATFLILAQRAHVIRKQDSLRSWLHGVALRVSKAMRRREARLVRREQQSASRPVISSPAELMASVDLQDVLRLEVDRLPEQYRVPLQLCYWHGQSREQMAETLGWSKGQVKGQLERAKRRLKARLDQRGISFLMPIGLGLTTVALISMLPSMVLAATVVTQASQMTSYFLGLGNVFYRTFQATKGVGSLAIIAMALGWMPPIPFLPIFPNEEEQKQLQQQGTVDRPEEFEEECYGDYDGSPHR